jgi:predicted transcriptional regulator
VSDPVSSIVLHQAFAGETHQKITIQDNMEFTVRLAGAYFGGNKVEIDELQNIIKKMFEIVVDLSRGPEK